MTRCVRVRVSGSDEGFRLQAMAGVRVRVRIRLQHLDKMRAEGGGAHVDRADLRVWVEHKSVEGRRHLPRPKLAE